jgi:hypothetical protein
MSRQSNRDRIALAAVERVMMASVSQADKDQADANKESTGAEYGVFVDTSGKVRVERINPRALYEYIYRTDGKPTMRTAR